MKNLKNSKKEQGLVLRGSKGFTIIEVLIVLAIAGLIILIVFLAVPALQRNSRNTQYKNQVATYLGAVNEFSNNNNGRVIVAGDLAAINNLAADGQLTEPTALTAGAQTTAPAVGTMQIQVGLKCDPATVGNTIATGATSRSIAIRYSVENSAGTGIAQCTGS